MAQSAFFLFTFVIAGSVFQLIRLWDSSIENQLVRIRRDRKLLKQKQDEERFRRQEEARRQYRSNRSHSRRTYEEERTYTYRPPANNTIFYGGILGIKEGADMPDIKKTYRAMVAKYHPDKVQHLGQEFQDLAEKKIKELNEAYDFFKRKYRFS